MNQRIADKITSWSLGPEYSVDSDKFQIVSYGILLMIETVYKILILMILGEKIGACLETVAFLIGFCGLRKFAGGLHMKTSLGCMMSVVVLWSLSIVCSMYCIPYPLYVIISLLTFILVGIYAPCSTLNNPIKSKELRKRKKVYALAYAVTLTIVAYILGNLGYRSVKTVLIVSMTLEGLTIIHRRKEI